MRGPSSEDERQQQSSYVNLPQHYQNMHYLESQVQHQPQENANFNGNNRSSYYSNGLQQQQNAGGEGYYPTADNTQPSPTSHNNSNPFAEYAWMADADGFDKQVMEQMEQEEYLEACFQEMWQEEENDGDWFVPPQGDDASPSQNNVESLDKLTLDESQPPTMLNPNAAEFIPGRQPITPQ